MFFSRKVQVISHFRRLRNVNFLGNPLNYVKIFELFLGSAKYLKTFNNQPIDKPIKNENPQDKIKKKTLSLKRKYVVDSSENENDENLNFKPSKIDEETKISPKNKDEKVKNETLKEPKILTNQPEVVKILNMKNLKVKKNNEQIKNILSKGEEKICKWD